ncbi:hypothetical protein ACJX0J_013518, partial [Zea mays]
TAIHFRASRNRQSSFGHQVIEFFDFYEIENPEHLFGEEEPVTEDPGEQQIEVAEQELIE